MTKRRIINQRRRAAWALGAASILFGLGLQAALEGRWEAGTPLPVPTGELQGVVLNGRPIVLGGLGPGWSVSARVFSYDAPSEVWTRLPDLPVPLNHHAAVALNGAIYVMGGASSFGPGMVEQAEMYMLPQGGEHWLEVSPMPAPRWGHGAAVIDGKIYVVGGHREGDDALFVFDPDTERWTTGPDIPTRRDHMAVVALDGLLYTIGGRVDGANVGVVEVFDPQTGRWSSRTPMPTPRSGMAAAVIDGRIHVAGGEDLASTDVFDVHEIYDPASDTWQTATPLPVGRHGAWGAGLADAFIVIGGSSRAGGSSAMGWLDRVGTFSWGGDSP